MTYEPQLAALGAAIGKWPEGCLPDCNKPRWNPDNDNLPRVVALTGAAGSGKSTAADYLVRHHGYERVKFAGPLKDMMRALGFDDRHIEGDLKETPLEELCGQTPRHAMQALGTAWGRRCIGEDFWIRMWRERSLRFARVVVDDCRFPNEAAAVRILGGVIIKLEGRGGIVGGHESEKGCGDEDLVIANDNGVGDLEAKIEEALRRYG